MGEAQPVAGAVGVIHEIDEALRTLVERELAGSGVEISFEAPTKDWAARRSAPTVDLYLYDIREDRERRNMALEPVRDETGRSSADAARRACSSSPTSSRPGRSGPRTSTGCSRRILACALATTRCRARSSPGSLLEQPLNMPVTVALPPPEDRALSDVWTALGGELKPSLDLVITAPVDSRQRRARRAAGARGAAPHDRRRRRRSGAGSRTAPEDAAGRATAGAEELMPRARAEQQPGRTIRLRDSDVSDADRRSPTCAAA